MFLHATQHIQAFDQHQQQRRSIQTATSAFVSTSSSLVVGGNRQNVLRRQEQEPFSPSTLHAGMPRHNILNTAVGSSFEAIPPSSKIKTPLTATGFRMQPQKSGTRATTELNIWGQPRLRLRSYSERNLGVVPASENYRLFMEKQTHFCVGFLSSTISREFLLTHLHSYTHTD